MSEIADQVQRLADQVERLERERDELRRRLAERQGEDSASSPPYLTVDQAAALASCSPKTIRRAIGSGLLRAFRPAGRLRILESDVRAWIESETAAPADAPPPARPRSRRPAPGSVASIRQIERQLG